MKYSVTNPETETQLAVVDLIDTAGNVTWDVTVFGEKNAEQKQSFAGATVSVERGLVDVRLDTGARLTFPFGAAGADGSVVVSTALGNLRLLPSRGVAADAAGGLKSAHKQIKSSMPGKILKLLCKPGDTVEAGQPLLIIEAMKMENEIRAVHGGVVEEVAVQPGQKVETGELLIKFGSGE